MLSGEKIGLRAVEGADLPQLLSWRNQPGLRRYFREYRELSSVQQERWFEQSVLNDPKTLMFAIVEQESGRLLGACGLCYINWVNRHADFSIYIGADNLYIDDAVAVDAGRVLLEYGFAEINLNRIWAEIYDFDTAKQALFPRLGFRLEGRHRQTHWSEGAWHDSLFYGIVAEDYARASKYLDDQQPKIAAGSEQLALFGGAPLLPAPLAARNTFGAEETQAVNRVMQSGRLSGFLGAWGEGFDGGPEVRAFEAEWCQRFGVAHAVTVNSATSGLVAALGAAGIGPGDEVILPPWTMSATAMAPLAWGGIPVFADIEPETFCLDPVRVVAAVTPRTRAIVAVNLFGHPAALHELRALADRHGLILIEDNAQAPLAVEQGRLAGTIGHIGVFSLNYHKHFHTGEGGVCVTADDDLALRLRLIRNHGENAVEPLGLTRLANLVGFNLRLTELQAAIGRAQLAKADRLVAERVAIADRLSEALSGLPGLTPPLVRPGCSHVYYCWMLRFDAAVMGVSRARFAQAVAAEGVPVAEGYVRPLYRLPVFQQRVAVGGAGFPFVLSDRSYAGPLCPVVEHLHAESALALEICCYRLPPCDLERVIAAFHKVYHGRGALA